MVYTNRRPRAANRAVKGGGSRLAATGGSSSGGDGGGSSDGDGPGSPSAILSAAVAECAGLNPTPNIAPSPGKTSDARWFRANPTRSHRLRRCWPGELVALPNFGKLPAAPAGYEYEMLVRQIAVGVRIRFPFRRHIAARIPDVEAILHALFDLNANGEPRDRISAADVIALARTYQAGGFSDDASSGTDTS